MQIPTGYSVDLFLLFSWFGDYRSLRFWCVYFGRRTFYFMEDLFMGTLLLWICLIPALAIGIPLAAFSENAFLQFLGCIICLGLCILGAYLYHKYRDADEIKHDEELKEKANRRYKCPNCGAVAGKKISALSKDISITIHGVASDKIGKTYKCEKCGYLW